MKFLAIFVTLALFTVMGYLILDQRNQATILKNEFELLRRQQNPDALNQRELELAKLETQLLQQQASNGGLAPAPAPAPALSADSLPPLNPPPSAAPSAAPAPSGLPPLNPPPMTADQGASTGGTIAPTTPLPAPSAPPLTARQRQIQGAPPIGKINEYQKEYGFVIIGTAPSMNVEVGMSFAIRRGHDVIGRVKVNSVDQGSTIADIIGGSVPPGVTVAAGDDIIQDLP